MVESINYDSDYYEKIIKDFGYDKSLSKIFDFKLSEISSEELMMRWLCHHNGEQFSKNFSQKGNGIVSTGFGLSGVPHIGTLAQIKLSLRLQSAGIPVSMVIGDLDAYNNKGLTLDSVIKLTPKYKNFIRKLGFKENNGSILRNQYDDFNVLRRSYLIGQYFEDDFFDQAEEDIYGKYRKPGESTTHKMPYPRKLSLNLMIADFIDLFYHRDVSNVLVMLGIDEHRYVLLAQKILERMIKNNVLNGHYSISGLYTPIIKGFNNHPKMSKSILGSGITVDMEPNEIEYLINNCEGKYQNPNENVVFQMITLTGDLSLNEIKKAYFACKEKNNEWNLIKSDFSEYLISLCKFW